MCFGPLEVYQRREAAHIVPQLQRCGFLPAAPLERQPGGNGGSRISHRKDGLVDALDGTQLCEYGFCLRVLAGLQIGVGEIVQGMQLFS